MIRIYFPRKQHLYHVTPCHNRQSILDNGLLTVYATSVLKRIWLVCEKRILWAIGHVAKKYKVRVWDVCTLAVDLDVKGTTQYRRGVYYVEHNIHPNVITEQQWQ